MTVVNNVEDANLLAKYLCDPGLSVQEAMRLYRVEMATRSTRPVPAALQDRPARSAKPLPSSLECNSDCGELV